MPYKDKKIVVFGVSRHDDTKYGRKIFTALTHMGFEVYGINPQGGMVEGRPLFPDLRAVNVKPDVAIMVVQPKVLVQAVQQCLDAGVSEIWFQPGSRLEEAYHLATSCGIKAIESCFMMENKFW